MEGFTLIDGIAAVVIVLSSILAYSRGFLRESLSIGGWILAAIVAFIFAPQAEPLIKEIPLVSDFLDGSCELAMILAFAGVFTISLIIFSLIAPLFSSAVQKSALSGIDQGLGFLFGFARGILLVVVALVAYDRIIFEPIPMVDESRAVKLLGDVQTQVNDAVPDEAPGWIVARYEELISNCQAPAETSDS